MPNVFPAAPNYGDVRWGGPDGLRIPAELGKATLIAGKEVDLNLTSAVSPLKLTPTQLGNYFTFSSATGAVTVSFPYNSGSKTFSVANHSGQTITVNIAAGPGGSPAASTGVAVSNNFRQMLCIDRQVADVRPLAAAIAY